MPPCDLPSCAADDDIWRLICPMTTKPVQVLFDAMYHGKYEFGDFLRGDVAANYDSILIRDRRIYRPNKKLKAYHSFLNTFLCEHLDLNGRVVYSYRKGVNPHQAVAAHALNRAFFEQRPERQIVEPRQIGKLWRA